MQSPRDGHDDNDDDVDVTIMCSTISLPGQKMHSAGATITFHACTDMHHKEDEDQCEQLCTDATECRELRTKPGVHADLGHQVPEALQEGVDLRLDGGGHAMPRHQVHILPLVLLSHPVQPNLTVSITFSMMKSDVCGWQQPHSQRYGQCDEL